MNKYIGTKLIEAEKATLAEAQALKTGACSTIEEAREKFGGSIRERIYKDNFQSHSSVSILVRS